ncbi:YbhN family protein [Actinoplanes sp. NPDC051851]|uniref:lysylphosphatidylglycerol synthase transmembrane domain-containing protein n=1 Tax=Actinoplanes sp. NPDC051851 TaxID=3154753 RepID=UPI0034162C29
MTATAEHAEPEQAGPEQAGPEQAGPEPADQKSIKDEKSVSGTVRRWLRVGVAVGALAVVVVLLRGRLPDPASVFAVVRQADPRWVAAALLAQFLAQAAFARQQSVLLAAFGVRIPAGEMVAITLSRSAMSMVLPAGSAASAAYALQRYRRRGAGTTAATATVLLSGVVSIAGLVTLYAIFSIPAAWRWALLALAAAALVTAGAATGRARNGRSGEGRTRNGRTGRGEREAGDGAEPPGVGVAGRARRVGRQLRAVGADHLTRAMLSALANWLFDLACLTAVAQACDLRIDAHHLATVYLAVQVARQIPITPGGVGLVEAALLAGLVAAGVPEAGATAVVLGYRLISFWLMLPAGLAAWLHLRRGGGPGGGADGGADGGAAGHAGLPLGNAGA